MASNSEPSRSSCSTTSGPSSSGLTSVAYRKSCLMQSSLMLNRPTSRTSCPTSISCTSIATCSSYWMQTTTGDSGVSTRRFLRSKCLTGTPWFQVKLGDDRLTSNIALSLYSRVSWKGRGVSRFHLLARGSCLFFEDVSVKGAFCSEVSPTHLHCSRALGSACSPGYWQHWKRAHIVCIGSYAKTTTAQRK